MADAAELALAVEAQISALVEQVEVQVSVVVELISPGVELVWAVAWTAFLYVFLAWGPPADLVLALMCAAMLFVVLHSSPGREYALREGYSELAWGLVDLKACSFPLMMGMRVLMPLMKEIPVLLCYLLPVECDGCILAGSLA